MESNWMSGRSKRISKWVTFVPGKIHESLFLYQFTFPLTNPKQNERFECRNRLEARTGSHSSHPLELLLSLFPVFEIEFDNSIWITHLCHWEISENSFVRLWDPRLNREYWLEHFRRFSARTFRPMTRLSSTCGGWRLLLPTQQVRSPPSFLSVFGGTKTLTMPRADCVPWHEYIHPLIHCLVLKYNVYFSQTSINKPMIEVLV